MSWRRLEDIFSKHLEEVLKKSWGRLEDDRNFYDQPINDSDKKYDEIRKIAIEKRPILWLFFIM